MMLAGNAGFVTEGATLMLSFAGVATRAEGLWRGGWLLGGLAALWLVAQDERLEHRTVRLMAWALRRWTDLEGYDYVELLELSEGYRVGTFAVNRGACGNGQRSDPPWAPNSDPPGSGRWPLWARAASLGHSAFRPFFVFIDSRNR